MRRAAEHCMLASLHILSSLTASAVQWRGSFPFWGKMGAASARRRVSWGRKPIKACSQVWGWGVRPVLEPAFFVVHVLNARL